MSKIWLFLMKNNIIFMLLLLTACSSTNKDDPLEPFNRKVYKFNDVLDKAILRPLAVVYDKATPGWTKNAIRSFKKTLFTPITFINYVLQGDLQNASKSLFGASFNIAFGFFGMHDTAKLVGIEYEETSFGNTLKKWGAGPGPFIVVPILGPSTMRDLAGSVIEFPISDTPELLLLKFNKKCRKYIRYSVWCIDKIDGRAKLLAFTDSAEKLGDAYALARSVIMRENYIEEDLDDE